MGSIISNFIGNLKVGDNIKYNLQCLDSLYSDKKIRNKYFVKFAIITHVSIIETIMIDFIRRVKVHTREFQYLDVKTRAKIRELKSDSAHWKFNESIKKFRHFRLIGKDDEIYMELDDLKELRNKIHIHNLSIDKNESNLWNKENLTRSERMVEYLILYMSKNYPRPLDDFVGGFNLPWNPHCKESLSWGDFNQSR